MLMRRPGLDSRFAGMTNFSASDGKLTHYQHGQSIEPDDEIDPAITSTAVTENGRSEEGIGTGLDDSVHRSFGSGTPAASVHLTVLRGSSRVDQSNAGAR